jgi:hypothetical protein
MPPGILQRHVPPCWHGELMALKPTAPEEHEFHRAPCRIFPAIATKPDKDGKRREVLRLQLGSCSDLRTTATNPRLRHDRERLRATDPDLETLAVLYEIVEFTHGRRRRGLAKAATVLRTGTHSEAPTWWQEYRSHVWIGIATGAVFYLLGLLTAHL